MKTYNIETVIAEKLQTIISKKNSNSRMKDYYDMYLIWGLNHHLVNLEILRRAVIVTFKYRETEFSIKEFNQLFDSLINDNSFNTRWNSFIRRNAYTEKVNFKLVIESITALLNEI